MQVCLWAAAAAVHLDTAVVALNACRNEEEFLFFEEHFYYITINTNGMEKKWEESQWKKTHEDQ